MVNGVSSIHKLGKYKRQKYLVTNRALNTTLPDSNICDNYNEDFDIGIK